MMGVCDTRRGLAHQVLQLAHIAGPVGGGQQFQCLGRKDAALAGLGWRSAARKCAISSGMSSRRRASGGISICTTFSR